MYMENVKEHYWRYSLITIILGLGVILFFKITPFLGGILGAFTIYILLRGQMFHLTEKLNMRPAFAALLLLGETILCFLIPITLAIWLVINKTQNINLDPTVLLNTGQHIADLVQEKTGFDVLDRGNLLKVASILPQIGQFLVGSISSFAVNVVVLIFILYFMLIGGRKMESSRSAPLRELSPLRTVRASFPAYGSSNMTVTNFVVGKVTSFSTFIFIIYFVFYVYNWYVQELLPFVR